MIQTKYFNLDLNNCTILCSFVLFLITAFVSIGEIRNDVMTGFKFSIIHNGTDIFAQTSAKNEFKPSPKAILRNISSFPDIPEELLLTIFNLLSTKTLAQSSLVCKHWHLLLHDTLLWKNLCRRESFKLTISKMNTTHQTKNKKAFPKFNSISQHIRNCKWSNEWKRMYKTHFLTNKNWNQGNYKQTLQKTNSLCLSLSNTHAALFPSSESCTLTALEKTSAFVLPIEFTRLGIITCIKFDDRFTVLGFRSGSVQIWDLTLNTHVKKLNGHSQEVGCVQFNRTVLVSGSEDASIRVWGFLNGKCRGILSHRGGIVSVSLNDTYIVSTSADLYVRVW